MTQSGDTSHAHSHRDGDPAASDEREIDKEHPLESLVENIQQTGEAAEGDGLSVGEMVDAFGRRSYGPLIALPALIALFPLIGAIPGLSIASGLMIILVSIQMLFSHKGIWLPKRLRQFQLPAKKVTLGAKKSKGWAAWTDRFISARLEVVTRPPLSYVTTLICLVLGISMIPLELVPMGVAPAAATVLLLSLGILANDGLLLLIGYAAAAACGGFLYYVLV